MLWKKKSFLSQPVPWLDEVLAGSAVSPPAPPPPRPVSPGQGVVGWRVRPVESLEHLPVVGGLHAGRGTCVHWSSLSLSQLVGLLTCVWRAGTGSPGPGAQWGTVQTDGWCLLQPGRHVPPPAQGPHGLGLSEHWGGPQVRLAGPGADTARTTGLHTVVVISVVATVTNNTPGELLLS